MLAGSPRPDAGGTIAKGESVQTFTCVERVRRLRFSSLSQARAQSMGEL